MVHGCTNTLQISKWLWSLYTSFITGKAKYAMYCNAPVRATDAPGPPKFCPSKPERKQILGQKQNS